MNLCLYWIYRYHNNLLWNHFRYSMSYRFFWCHDLINWRLCLFSLTVYLLIWSFGSLNFMFCLLWTLYRLLNKTILPVWPSWFLGFWLWFLTQSFLALKYLGVGNNFLLSIRSNVYSLSIMFFTQFGWRFVLNENSKIIWTFWRIITLWRLC